MSDTPNRLNQALDALLAVIRESYGPKIGFVMGFSVGDPALVVRVSNSCAACQRIMLASMLEELPPDTKHTHGPAP